VENYNDLEVLAANTLKENTCDTWFGLESVENSLFYFAIVDLSKAAVRNQNFIRKYTEKNI